MRCCAGSGTSSSVIKLRLGRTGSFAGGQTCPRPLTIASGIFGVVEAEWYGSENAQMAAPDRMAQGGARSPLLWILRGRILCLGRLRRNFRAHPTAARRADFQRVFGAAHAAPG